MNMVLHIDIYSLILTGILILFPKQRIFKECPHPDGSQRREIAKEVGLVPKQIKFWFQNKRTHMKVNLFSLVNLILKYYLHSN